VTVSVGHMISPRRLGPPVYFLAEPPSGETRQGTQYVAFGDWLTGRLKVSHGSVSESEGWNTVDDVCSCIVSL
jgi:hypothetical protein